MKHYGDITKLSGYTLPIVDVITGGSPCQDLSVAGKRAGLSGERSGLFMEQVRIVKEMRARDVQESGRAGQYVRPRYMVWENVPGAFSSNGGKDFQAVLSEIAKIAEPDAADVPMPEKGKWTNAGCIYDELGCWSIAWRVHDAQFWGVPQRRKRISLVADFGGLSAPEILFERKGLSRDPEPGTEAGEETARAVGSSSANTSGAMNPWDSQSARVYPDNGVWHSLNANENGGQSRDSVFCLQGNGIDRADTAGCNGRGWCEDVSYTLNTIDRPAVAFAMNQRNEVRDLRDVAGALAAEPGMKQQTFVAYSIDQQGGKGGANYTEDVCPPILSDSHGTPHAVAYGISSYDSNAMKSPNPRSGVYETDTARTLDLNGGSPACNQGGIAVVQSIGCDVYNQEITGDVAASLTAACGGTNTSGAKVLCLNDQGGSVMGVSEDVTGALRAQEHGHQPAVCAGFSFGQSEKARSIGYQEEVSPTLRGGEGGNQKPCVYDARGNGSGVIAPTLTGDHQNRVTGYTALCIGNGQMNQISMAEQANTLDTMHDSQAVMITAVDCRNGTENPDTNGTLQAKSNGGVSYNLQNVCRTGHVVRRFTPLECERLQGYPDGWTDIGEWTDSNGKKHKDADSPRYKALGNSIALPFWQWMARRICAMYERNITMASLFDGIGGFPLVFERCGAKAVWASEIEEFPIAVTKKHFPEVDAC